jgi:hypothetical protein
MTQSQFIQCEFLWAGEPWVFDLAKSSSGIGSVHMQTMTGSSRIFDVRQLAAPTIELTTD